MKKEYFERISFIGENKILVDNKIQVKIQKPTATTNRKYIIEGVDGEKTFEDDKLLFDYVDEMTDTGSVGGGYEGPGLAPASALIRKTFGPYNDIVETVESLVKTALIEEFVKDHPQYKLIELYREANKKESEKFINDVEEGIKIVYAQILPPVIRNYYQDNNDYNGDGIPNQYKENNTLLDLQYDGASEAFKERVADQLTNVPAIGNAANQTEKSTTGVDMMNAAIKKAELKTANPTNHDLIQLGGDIEFAHNVNPTEQPKEKTKAESSHRHGIAALGFKLKEGQMLKFNFKTKIFEDRKTLLESIPNKVKQDGTLFEMQDSKGNNFRIKWQDNTATILEHKNLIQEQAEQDRMSELFEYKSRTPKSKKVTFDLFTKPSKTNMLKEEFEQDMEDKVRDLNSKNYEGHAVSELLDLLDKEYGGYGVEVVRDHQFRPFYGDIRLEYINMGDSYVKTIIYDVDDKTFVASSLGDYIEQNNITTK